MLYRAVRDDNQHHPWARADQLAHSLLFTLSSNSAVHIKQFCVDCVVMEITLSINVYCQSITFLMAQQCSCLLCFPLPYLIRAVGP